VALVVVAGGIAWAIRRVPFREFTAPYQGSAADREPLTEFEWLLLAIIVVCLAARTVASMLAPLSDWDGVVEWGLKAKVVYFNTVRDADYFHRQDYSYSNAPYPLLWPFMYAWMCTAAGGWDDVGMMLLNPINLIVFSILLYATIRRFAARTVALGITAIMASLPTIQHYAECGQADVPLMLISGASLFCLFDWMQHRRLESLLLAAVLMGGALFTKQEGRIILPAHLAGATLSILLAAPRPQWKRCFGQLALYASIALAMAAPWFIYQRTITVTDVIFTRASIFTMRWELLPTVIGIIIKNALILYNQVSLPKWNLLFPILIGATLLSCKKVMRPPWVCLWAVWFVHACGIVAVYLAANTALTFQEAEIGWERYTVIILPPLWLVLAFETNYFWNIWKSTRPATGRPALTPSPAAR